MRERAGMFPERIAAVEAATSSPTPPIELGKRGADSMKADILRVAGEVTTGDQSGGGGYDVPRQRRPIRDDPQT